MAGNGLGFASQSSFLIERSLSDRELRIPIDEVEASITHEAVEALKTPRPHLYEVLHLVYPFGLGAGGTAKRLGCSRSNVYALLDVADRVLAAWFTERAERQAKAKEASEAAYRQR
ncbi:hypothetical protein [uncultured Pseudacidovorax sp.]|uniref:hypothetical protein n=1 Tax=uncultured Pseudacidovorax sp. TaxID=679313 RepID=UPI0025EB21B9|nr:hypothetical protein [uncultured Pseudacidovorax sp.]